MPDVSSRTVGPETTTGAGDGIRDLPAPHEDAAVESASKYTVLRAAVREAPATMSHVAL